MADETQLTALRINFDDFRCIKLALFQIVSAIASGHWWHQTPGDFLTILENRLYFSHNVAKLRRSRDQETVKLVRENWWIGFLSTSCEQQHDSETNTFEISDFIHHRLLSTSFFHSSHESGDQVICSLALMSSSSNLRISGFQY